MAIFFILLSPSAVSAGDTLREADNRVGDIINSILEYFLSEDEKPVSTDVVETDSDRCEASDEDDYVDIESGVTPPVSPEDTVDEIKKIYPSIVDIEQKGSTVKLHLEFLDYHESASPVYGESFTYDPEGVLDFKLLSGKDQVGNIRVSCLEFNNGHCFLSVPGVDEEFDRVEIWKGPDMLSSKEFSPGKKVTAEVELEISSLYHDFDDYRETITVTATRRAGHSSSYWVYAAIHQKIADPVSGLKTNSNYRTKPFSIRFGEDGFATSPAFEIEPGGHNEVTVTLYDEASGEKISEAETLRV